MNKLLKKEVFSPLEKYLLVTLKQRTTPASAELLSRQMDRINLAQRHSDGREVNYYPIHRGRPVREESIRFPETRGEQKFAIIEFDVPGSGSFTAEFFLVDGYFFSIEFTPSPAKVKERTDVVIRNVEIAFEPFRLQPPVGRHSGENTTMRGLNAVLPPDYLSLSAGSENHGETGVTILPEGDVYSVVLEHDSFYVLAEVEDYGVLGVRKHGSDGMVFLLPFDGVPRKLCPSLRKAITTLPL